MSHIYYMTKRTKASILLALTSGDNIPSWVTHTLWLEPGAKIVYQGVRGGFQGEKRRGMPTAEQSALAQAKREKAAERKEAKKLVAETKQPKPERENRPRLPSRPLQPRRRWYKFVEPPVDNETTPAAPLIEMQGVQLRYGQGKHVLGGGMQDVDGERRDGLWWELRPGDRWGLFGPNGKHLLLGCLSNVDR